MADIDKYKVTVGIECHVQLDTDTKLFSGADNDERDKSPNSVVSPIDYGLPGMLPVLNRQAVNLAVKAAKALSSPVAKISRFDRKHYFYPDLPKGYQISQMYQPIIEAGLVEVPLSDGSSFKVRINHAHLEEDAGKLTHVGNYSLVDLNRAGTPLIEIVSEPDIHSATEAKAYAMELYYLMLYAGVTRGDLYHGNMRFDVNVSIAPKESSELGTRTEVKNLNSFRSVERAVEYEVNRQAEVIEKGGKVVQETRGWNDDRQVTTSQRSKENAQDYRYMPDPDIPPIVLDDEEVKSIQSEMLPLPPFYREKWRDIELDESIIGRLIMSPSLARLFDKIVDESSKSTVSRRIGSWLTLSIDTDDENSDDLSSCPSIPVNYYVDLSEMVESDKLNSTAGKQVFIEMMKTANKPEDIANRLNLIQISDDGAIEQIVDEVLSDPSAEKAVEDLKNGNNKVIGFLIGQVMQKSAGKANPSKVQSIIKAKLNI